MSSIICKSKTIKSSVPDPPTFAVIWPPHLWGASRHPYIRIAWWCHIMKAPLDLLPLQWQLEQLKYHIPRRPKWTRTGSRPRLLLVASYSATETVPLFFWTLCSGLTLRPSVCIRMGESKTLRMEWRLLPLGRRLEGRGLFSWSGLLLGTGVGGKEKDRKKSQRGWGGGRGWDWWRKQKASWLNLKGKRLQQSPLCRFWSLP